jgi:hypothetical protein
MSQSRLETDLADSVQGFGGILRCDTCQRTEPLGDPGQHLRTGWPKCHGYTMRWWTQRQIDNGEYPLSPQEPTERMRDE